MQCCLDDEVKCVALTEESEGACGGASLKVVTSDEDVEQQIIYTAAMWLTKPCSKPPKSLKRGH
jgi:hypothetical protein